MKCAICGKEVNSLRGLSNHLRSHSETTTKEYYDTYLKKPEEGVCAVCGKETSFGGLAGYNMYCSVTCANSDPLVQCKKKSTFKNAPKLRKGAISLSAANPEVAKEWDFERNAPLTPELVSVGSERKVWWICPKGHRYDGTIVSRTQNNCGCPYCSGHRVLVGENDLQTTHPQLVEEWHPTKNGSLKPTDVMKGSGKKVWWLGKCGHEWFAAISPRCNGVGCPKCRIELHTSFSEQAVYFYVKQYFPDAINGDKTAIGMELDIYIPSLRIAIEYDGKAYHKPNRKNDKIKNEVCKREHIKLIRLQETEDSQYDDCLCLVRKNDRSKNELNQIIQKLLCLLGTSYPNVDVIRDEQKIRSLYLSKKDQNSLQAMYPDLADEWHPEKNGLLTPDKVVSGSMSNVWWLGKCGHEWKARVAHRAKGVGCPYCSGAKVLSGYNDLQSQNPELAEEWDYKKNKIPHEIRSKDTLTPDKVYYGSNKKVWWTGKCGHSWEESIANRMKGYGCPYCSNHRLLVGFNDLASRYPEIAKEWSPTKNGELSPDQVLYGSGKQVWWHGACGHEWKTRVVDRTVGGAGCPYCSGSMGVRVMCVETGKVYANLSEACKDVGTHKASIVNCCKGRQQKAGGFHWKYYESLPKAEESDLKELSKET